MVWQNLPVGGKGKGRVEVLSLEQTEQAMYSEALAPSGTVRSEPACAAWVRFLRHRCLEVAVGVLCAWVSTSACTTILGATDLTAAADVGANDEGARPATVGAIDGESTTTAFDEAFHGAARGVDSPSGAFPDARGPAEVDDEQASRDASSPSSRPAVVRGEWTEPASDADDRSTFDEERDAHGGDAVQDSDGEAPDVASHAVEVADAGPHTVEADLETATAVDGDRADEDGSLDAGRDAAEEGGSDLTVRGRLFDSWHLPIRAARVVIGDKDPVVTAVDGSFQIEHVTPPYDVTILLPEASEVWIFEGLDLVEPTLQTNRPFAPQNRATVRWNVINGALSPSSNLLGMLTFGSSGRFYSSAKMLSDSSYDTLRWFGASARTQGAFHMLRMLYSTGLANVERYEYASVAGALEAGGTTEPTFDLTDARALDTTTLRVNTDGGSNRVMVSVNLEDDSVIEVIRDTPPSGERRYNVPKREGWRYSVAALRTADTVGAAVAHKRHLEGDAIDVSLFMPEQPAPLLPASGASGVDPSTVFGWSGPTGVNMVSLIIGASQDVRICIVTARKSVTLPKLPPALGVGIPRNADSSWAVLVPGIYRSTDQPTAYESVDEIAGPNGYDWPYSSIGTMEARERGDGTQSWSRSFSFRTVP